MMDNDFLYYRSNGENKAQIRHFWLKEIQSPQARYFKGKSKPLYNKHGILCLFTLIFPNASGRRFIEGIFFRGKTLNKKMRQQKTKDFLPPIP